MRSTYWSSPTMNSEEPRASRASGGMRVSSPGPRLTSASLPRTGSRPIATVAFADFRFSSNSAPEDITAASATLGVPTASRTSSDGFGRLDHGKHFGRMEVDRDVQLRRYEQSRFVALQVDAGEGRDALLCQCSLRQGVKEQVEYLLRTHSSAATDAGDERRWPVDHGRTGHLHEPVGDEDKGRLPFVRPDYVLG